MGGWLVIVRIEKGNRSACLVLPSQELIHTYPEIFPRMYLTYKNMQTKGQGLNHVVTALIFTSLLASGLGQLKPDEEDYNVDEIKWGLTNRNKTDTCILLNGIIQVMIPYETPRNTLNDVTLLTVPRNASVYGQCGDPIQNITLSWPPPQSDSEEDDDGIPKHPRHSLTLSFIKKGEIDEEDNDTFSEPYFELDSVYGVFHAGEAEFPGYDKGKTEFILSAKHLGMLSAPVGLSFFCETTQVVDSNTQETTLMLSLMQVQAFHVGLSDTAPDGVDFGPRSYCPRDGYKMILTVVGFVLFLSLLGIIVFLIVNWLRPKRRTGYWNL